MNVERLHNIIFQVKKDLDNSNLQTIFNNLVNSVAKLAEAQNDPACQEAVSVSRDALNKLLEKHASNSYPPSWKVALGEMNLNWFIASDLQEVVEEAFEGNDVTPATIAKKLQEINTDLSKDMESITNLLSAFEELHFGREQLNDGESEVSVSIPHKAIDSDLIKFGQEIGHIEKMFRPFTELVTGSPQDLKIKSISSSNLVVTFLIGSTIILAAKVVKAIAEAVSAVLEAVAKVQKLREVQGTLADFDDHEGSKKLIAETKKYAKKIVYEEINKAAAIMAKEYTKGDKGRKNELENSLRLNMQKLAFRIDNGWFVETRMGEVQEPEKDDKTDAAKKQRALFKSYTHIKIANEQQMMFEPEGEPLLGLPEPEKESKKTQKQAKTKTTPDKVKQSKSKTKQGPTPKKIVK